LSVGSNPSLKVTIPSSPFGDEKDTLFMQAALVQARKAFSRDEVPIGAVIVSPEGNIVARAYNQVEAKKTQSAHAEVLVINKVGKKIQDWRLNGYWLYVTLEPCSLCMNLIYLSRLSGVVFGAPSPLFGYRLDNGQSNQVYKRATVMVIEGVCAQDSAKLLRRFFNQKRSE